MFGIGRKVKLESEAEKRIVSEIATAESGTRAEIRVHLAAKVRKDPYSDAIVVFKKLGMQKTELRSGILIYVIPSEKKFAIIGDVGIHEKVTDAFWQDVSHKMTQAFQTGDIAEGIALGIAEAGLKLKAFFPWDGHNPNEMSNEISRD